MGMGCAASLVVVGQLELFLALPQEKKKFLATQPAEKEP